jgi:methyltransferase (TIGR00027 family)
MPPQTSGEDETIVDEAGATSRLTAAARARESVRGDRLFDDAFAADLAGSEGFDALDRHDAGLADSGRLSPNPVFAIRTRFFDDFLLNQVAQHDVRQVVLVAAGLDTRAFRLEWPAGTRLFELDQPEVLAYKDRVLGTLSAGPRCDRTVVGLDFREPWVDVLLGAGYRVGERSVWLAEGLTFYLAEAAVRNLFRDIARLATPGDALGSDFVTQAPPGVDAAFGFTTEDPTQLFSDCGWSAERHTFDRECAHYGRAWPSPLRPLGYMTIAHRLP